MPRELVVGALAIAAVHALACLAVRAIGFDHVSDDDFARVTIAQTFAHAPKLDPSGTSWLPFPFWTLGTVLAAFGRSLATARAASIAFASLAAATPWLVLRLRGAGPKRATVAIAFALLTPWALWLGAATVPESTTATLTAAGTLGVSAALDARVGRGGAWVVLSGLAIVAACLSRYEAWPAAAVLAVAAGVAGARTRRASWIGLALLTAAGPLLWMAWNAHAHDGPLHFFRRVSAFKRALGEGATDPVVAILAYPRLLLTTRPEVTVPALLLLPLLRDVEIRRRWALPLLTVLAELVFLAYGNVRDGAPAHHPERALLASLVVLALFVVDAGAGWLARLRDVRGSRHAWVAGGAVLVLWMTTTLRDALVIPGNTPTEDRREQIARGLALRAEGPAHVVLTPCGFEHFALLAAYAAPERAEIRPRTGALVSPDCPRIER